MLQHLSAARPVQHRTEEFRTGQNSTILPTDGRQPFNHFTFKYPPHTLTQPSQSSFPRPGQPTSAMAETSHPRPVPDGRASLTSTTLHTEPSKSPPERPTTSHSPPSFVQGSSTGSGRQLEESPSSRRKKIKSKRVGSYRCMYPGCYATSPSAKAFKRHEQLHQAPDPKAKCGRCGRQLSRVDSLAWHERKCQRRGLQELVESSQESGEQEG